jgi:UDP-N-acetyl-D-glucosamine dehydrogenase
MRNYTLDLSSVALTEDTLRQADCVLIVTNHAAVDYGLVARHASLIVDTRDAMRGHSHANVVKA